MKLKPIMFDQAKHCPVKAYLVVMLTLSYTVYWILLAVYP